MDTTRVAHTVKAPVRASRGKYAPAFRIGGKAQATVIAATAARLCNAAVNRCRLQGLSVIAAICLGGPAQAAPDAADTARVVTLAPHITELVFAAGAGPLVVGTVNSSNYPPQAETLPRVGDGLNVNAELLLNLKPTHVLSWQRGGAALVLAPLLQNLGITLGYVEPGSVADIPALIETLGNDLGTQSAAANATLALRQTLSDLHSRFSQSKPVSVLIEIGQNPPYTLGNDPLTNDALRYCAARNMYANVRQVAPQIQQEYVLAHQPDVVLVPSNDTGTGEHVRERWAALGLRAAQQGHVITVHADAFLRPGPRLVPALKQVCEQIDRIRQTLR